MLQKQQIDWEEKQESEQKSLGVQKDHVWAFSEVMKISMLNL